MARRERPLIEPGRVLHEYSPAEASELAERWLAAFAANGFGTGSRDYLWHVFSFEATPALSKAKAQEQYELESSAEYVVLSDDRDVAFVTDRRPTASSLSDWFVFPPNMAWTIAFTHEDGLLGPYFARHPMHAALDLENQALLKKKLALEDAKQRGWA